jgi:hypothetical protein
MPVVGVFALLATGRGQQVLAEAVRRKAAKLPGLNVERKSAVAGKGLASIVLGSMPTPRCWFVARP